MKTLSSSVLLPRSRIVGAILAATLVITGCSNGREADGATASSISFDNPIVEQRADPWIYRTEAGRYYLIATAPEFDRIELRGADSIQGLSTAEAEVIWRKHATGPMGAHIWAPELHRIDGVWYIYFAAGTAEKPWNIRMYVLSNDAENPMTGEWYEEGRLQTQRDSFSLDATTFEHHDQRYLIWAQEGPKGENNSNLYISAMASPTELTGPEVLLTEPELPWEVVGYKVNEGPAVLIRNGRVFVTYSASATDHNYAMGLLWADADADLLNPASWHKSQEPVFFTNPEFDRYGPGHNSFTVAADGKTDVLIYHARDYRELQGSPLTDPNRDMRARVLEWTENGFPEFGQNRGD